MDLMRGSMGRGPGWRPKPSVPTMAEVMALAGHGFSSGDQARAKATGDVLARTMVTYSGAAGGFALQPEISATVLDKTRLKDGPFKRCNWSSTRFLEFNLPIFNESSRANGSRWGGMNGQIGLPETSSQTATASGPALARAVYRMCRFTVFSPPISRDLLTDSDLVAPLLDYAARSEIRFLIDQALIQGNSSIANTPVDIGTPEGVLGSPSAVGVKRASGNAIAAADIDALWSRIAGPNKCEAVWHCSDEVYSTIDQIAVSGQWSESIYLPQGKNGNEYALIKGRPLIPCEACSALGTNGDLICVDWSDYYIYFHKMQPLDSTLLFDVRPASAKVGSGYWGLPQDGLIESRMSDEFLFLNDEVVFAWKARLDGHFMWSGPVTNLNGVKVGPAAYLTSS